jgi:choline-sulfatase
MHAGSSPTPLGPYTHYLQEKGLLQAFHKDYEKRRLGDWIKGQSHDSILPTEAFEDVYIGRRAAKWIENIPDDFPWHFFVSFVGPHDPFDPPAEYGDRYRNAKMVGPIRDPMEGKPAWQKKGLLDMDTEEVTVTRRQYCALIELIDDQIGLILNALDRRGMRDNTYIVFASDHGEMLGDHGMYNKSQAYEPSLRVPLIISGPGIEPGRVSDALVELIDINPTICELAGLPSQDNIDAQSFWPVLGGEVNEHRAEAVSTILHFRSIRTKRHKLVRSYNDIPELYDLETDPQELYNVADDEPELVHELGRRMGQRLMQGKWLR